MERSKPTPDRPERLQGRFPGHGWIGLLLVVIAWALNWGLGGLRTHVLFFPLWLGYCLVVDAFVVRRDGDSLLTRNPLHYGGLFLLSIPFWWIFEGLNEITANWVYLGRESFSGWRHFLFSSLSFSTVIPAVFSTAELIGGMRWLQRLPPLRFSEPGRRLLWFLHFSGWSMLGLMLWKPGLFFPFMWLSWFFILDPLNSLRGRRSLIFEAAGGGLRPLLAFGLGALVCGFFWEFWNVYSYPKWIYEIPYLEVLHIFEMPLAGYGGYPPFGWELFAFYQFFVPRGWQQRLRTSSGKLLFAEGEKG